ncbi:MAG: DUF1800 domain-containing protein [Thalassovita sp.]
MSFDPVIAETRFGTGLSPVADAPRSVQDMLARLTGPDHAADQFQIESYDQFRQRMTEAQEKGKIFRRNRGAQNVEELRKAYNHVKQEARRAQSVWMMQTLARRSTTADGFRERLAAFWADHFTVIGKGGVMRRVASPTTDSFIRPYLTGQFSDLLLAAVTSPAMVNYLDQQFSVGPNAPAREKMPPNRGLNENLAREVMELHTLGVEAPYSQRDVRELAELLTGLGIGSDHARVFRPEWAEPGAETVLGRSYGGDPAQFADIRAVMDDLARHPATARHLSGKLAVHFLGDVPDPGLTRAMETAWLDTGGDLLAVYAAMLGHSEAWRTERRNVKLPFDFMSSALRALNAPPNPFRGRPNDVEQRIKKHFIRPLRRMGQPWEEPQGPDGWPEQDEMWITPQGVATRMEWALRVPQVLVPDLPDPRMFVEQAIGGNVPEAVQFAARAAESRHEGIALVLISPAFQRR